VTGNEWGVVLVAAMVVVLVALGVGFVRWRAGAARRVRPPGDDIVAARRGLAQLRDELARGQIDSADFDVRSRQLAAELLQASAAPAGARGAADRGPVLAGGLLALIAVGLGVGAFVVLRGAGPGGASVASVTAPSAPAAPTPASGGSAPARVLTDVQLERMVDDSLAKVRADAKDATAWAMLAHSYDMLGKFAESSKAYASLAGLLPRDAQVLADYADALGVAQGRTLKGEPTRLIERALAADARNLKALSLAGSAAYEREAYGQAIGYWQQALAADPQPEFKRQIEASIADAQSAQAAARAASSPPGATSGASLSSAAPSVPRASASLPSAQAFLSGRVSLADELVSKAAPDATVFIFARPVKGSRMPVALLRKRVRDLPLDFRLDDSMSMVPDVKLSQNATVVIGARVSLRGDVMPQPGDMQGWSAPVAVGTRGIKLEIGEVIK